MKGFRLLAIVLTTIFISVNFTACDNDDYDILTDRVDNLEDRISKLEELCRQMNTNISSLQTIVAALEENDYVTSVTPINKDGKEVGYTITFTKSKPITIYHGKDGENGTDGTDGKDGANGSDGKDGINGKDGVSPVIGVSKDTDGIYYWTLNGEWLLDKDGNKIKAVGIDGQNGEDGKDGVDGEDGKDGTNGSAGVAGKDGVTPQLKIEDNFWYVSYDNGTNWSKLGAATTTADEIFKNVTVDDENVIFTLADNTSFTLPRYKAVSITFDMQEQGITAGTAVQIPYTLTRATDKTIVSASSDGNYKVKLENQTTSGGMITVTAPDFYVDGYINILVSDGNGYTTLHVINFYEWQMSISNLDDEQSLTYSIPTDGGNVSIPLDVNFEYDLVIPTEAADWVITTVESRAVIRHETISIDIKPNMTNAARSCIVLLLPKNGTEAMAKFRIQQRSQAQTQVEKVFGNQRIIQLEDRTYTYTNGFLTRMDDPEGSAMFYYNYPAKTKANGMPDVTVKYKGKTQNPNYTLKVWVNSQGFAEEIQQTNDNNYGNTYSSSKTCTYDPEGHLIFMKDSRENREYTITWNDGNITQVLTKCFLPNGGLEWERIHDFDYHNTANSNNNLLYYNVYDIDIDEVDCLYWAGLLGIAPKNLAKSMTITDKNDPAVYEQYTYEWFTNSLEIRGYGNYDITFTFQQLK